MEQTMSKDKVCEIVTNQIIAMLEKGVVPWKKTWKGVANLPKNLKSKKEYRGINPFMLAVHGYASPWWVSFNQCKALGGTVKKGEKGTIVIFWKPNEKKVKDEDGNECIKKTFVRMYYRVFNTEQCEGLKVPEEKVEDKKQFVPIEEAERIIAEYREMVEVAHGGGRACYSPARDKIGMPEKDSFDSPEAYYCTLFHETVHSTGHKSRLDRLEDGWFGSEPYSKEELVAELGAAFLCGMTGLEKVTIDNSASYINAWLEKLRNDKRFILNASAQAQKACDYILNKKETVNEQAQATE